MEADHCSKPVMSGSWGGVAESPETLRCQASRHCCVDPAAIEIVLPCTSFQYDALDRLAYSNQGHVGHVVYEIPFDVDLGRLASSWKEAVNDSPALQTRVVELSEGRNYQVLISGSFTWTTYKNDVSEVIRREEMAAAVNGAACNRYAVLEVPGLRKRHLIWTFSHLLVGKRLQDCALGKVSAVYDAAEGGVNPASPVEPTVTFNFHAGIAESATAEKGQQGGESSAGATFPTMPPNQTRLCPEAQTEHRCTLPLGEQHKQNQEAICYIALAKLLCLYTDAPVALFGVFRERTSSHVSEAEGANLHREVVPLRVHCPPNWSLSDAISQLLSAHSKKKDEPVDGLDFQTVLEVTQVEEPELPLPRLHQFVMASSSALAYTNKALLLSCEIGRDLVRIHARYDPSVIDQQQMTRFLRQLGGLIQQCHQVAIDCPLGNLNAVPQEDYAEITKWNRSKPRTRAICIHDEITQKTLQAPDKTAVWAWDGSWSYGDMDQLSSRLASHICSRGHEVGSVVPLCFDKSKWVVVAMLAVLKAGRAFTLIDPTVPRARMEQICHQTSATFALTTKNHVGVMGSHVSCCLCLDDGLLASLAGDDHGQPNSSPGDVAYVLFTSGSTGQPKGSRITHQGFVSCSSSFGPALGLQSRTRALQFASYAFGASLVEILSTLMHGGCVCLPSEEDRMNDVTGFMKRAGVNWALFTPSFIGVLSPENVTGLETLVLGGEPISAEMRDIWASHVALRYAYGQSETATVCSVATVEPETSDLNNIGRAAGARFWVTEVDEPDRLSPIGCFGELVVESPGVALGYLVATPEQTSSFLTKLPPWYPAADRNSALSLYRTGDLVCYRSDGTLRYFGRKDSQIKIRGQRVELGEIEAKVRTRLSTQLTVVAEAIDRPGTDNSKSIVLLAFLIGQETGGKSQHDAAQASDAYLLEPGAAEDLKKALHQDLSAHAIPSHYIRVLTRPLTATGKTDRRTLRSIGARLLAEKPQTRTAPLESMQLEHATRAERTLHQLWYGALQLDPHAEHANVNFFEAGGDSIAAIKMVNRARSAGITLTVRDVFQHPTYGQLEAAVRPGSTRHHPIPPLLSASQHSKSVDLSFGQGRLWFLHQLHPDASWYHISLAARLQGPLDSNALAKALNALEQRHETLRTTFEQGPDGQGLQVIHGSLRPRAVKLEYASASDHESYKRILSQEQETPFDLATDPAWRVALIQLNDDDHILSIVMHHIISDGWSLDLMIRELGHLYLRARQTDQDPHCSAQLAALPIQYRDYAAWQRREEQVVEHEKQLAYWKTQLKDSIPAELLTDRPRPERLSGRAGIVKIEVDGEMHRQLQAFCQSHQTTPFVVLLAVFRAAHFRLTGAEDSTIGTPSANRNRPELEGLVGFFVNNQCMRITVDEETTLDGLVRQVRSTAMAAAENQDVPFERLVSELVPSRDTSKNPLVQLIFALHAQRHLNNIPLEGLKSSGMPTAQPTRFDLECHLFQETDHLHGHLLFAEDLFEPETIQGLAKTFQELLRRGLGNPQSPFAMLPLTDGLDDLKRLGLLDIKHKPYDRDASVVELFQQQVYAWPDEIAVMDVSSSLTYAQLSAASDRIAFWLRKREVASETIVGVLAPRSCEAIVAFLGIMKANAAYLPLDVTMPSSRLDAILSAAGGSTLAFIGRDAPRPEPALTQAELVPIDAALKDGATKEDSLDAISRPSATSLAYAVFTSGSTGQPKGVLVQHRSIIRLVQAENVSSRLPHRVRMAHVMNLSFDASTWEIYTALLTGGTLVCIDYMTTLDSKALKEVFVQRRIQAATLPPVLLKQCLERIPLTLAGLDVLHTGGDRLDPQDAIQARSLLGRGFFNAYGPAENTVISAIHNVDQDDRFVHGVPIGRAVDNSGAYVMDAYQQLVPLGAIGELVVTGDGLARGYIDPVLNNGRFLDVNINGRVERGYRTGDRVRQRPKDGLLEFFGRVDHQIKIRGHRIEPAEVEQAMLTYEPISAAAVVVRDGDSDARAPEMVGFVTTRASEVAAQEAEALQVEGWSHHFDASMQADIEAIHPSKAGRDFTGWTSMYDGSSIEEDQMEEWLQDTLKALLNGQPAGNVLEIGTGTGMVLLNLGDGLRSYVGLEPSRSAATFVNRIARGRPDLAGKATVHVGTATAAADAIDCSPDTIVLNSVVQYFPSAAYLEEVIRILVQIPGAATLFFGDLRPYALNKQFLAGRARRALGDNATKQAVEAKMAELEAREEELLVDPGFFTRLVSDERVAHVEILPKNMRATNELSAYRYAAVVHLHSGRPLPPARAIPAKDWFDWKASNMSKQSLAELLCSSEQTSVLAVRNIQVSKGDVERHLLRSLRQENAEETTGSWIAAADLAAEREESASAADLHDIASQAGFCVDISWARHASQDGAMDAVFHHHRPTEDAGRTFFQFPTEEQTQPNGPLINQPVQQHQHRLTATQLGAHLQTLLPPYMIPAQIVVLDEMPLNPSGKVDRRALAQHALRAPRNNPISTRQAARNPTEKALCEEFSEVLGVEVGIDDTFFEHGGHSLMATKVAARISRRLDAQISVKDIFDHPKVRDLAATLERGTASHRAMPSSGYSGPVEQSFAQGRLWFLHQLHQHASWYSMPLAVRLRGPLQKNALRVAFNALAQRHEILRTTFEDHDGVGMQVVQEYDAKELRVIDASQSEDESIMHLLRKEQQEEFNLSAQPGWRVALIQLKDNEDHILSITMHHILSDGWSVDIFVRELSRFYKLALLSKDPLSSVSPLPVQYRDFAAWQRQGKQQEEHERQLAYWERQLKDSIPAELRTDRPRPARLSGQAGYVPVSVRGPLYARLQDFCRGREVTPFVALLAAFRVAHFRITGAGDATIGTPIANRNRPELENIIGFFVNTQCIRIGLGADDCFEDVVQRAYATAADAFAHQDVPFERIVSTLLPGIRDTSRNPLVQLMFALHSQKDLGKVQLDGLTSETLPIVPATRFDIEFHLWQEDGRLGGDIFFATDLYEPETIKSLGSVFQEVLRQGLERPDIAVPVLPLTNGREDMQRLGLLPSSTVVGRYETSVVDLFCKQVKMNADATAVADATSRLTFAELDLQSQRLATWLQKLELVPETLVGVLAPRSCEAIVAYLGILKAGLAYLPLDTNVPAARTDAVLAAVDGHKHVLIGSKISLPDWKGPAVSVVRICDTLTQDVEHDGKALRGRLTRPGSGSLAYTIFTSGSTGKPKGVMVEHRSIIRLVRGVQAASELPKAVRVAHLSNSGFDASVWEIFVPLLTGGTVVCIDRMSTLDYQEIEAIFAKENIQAALITTALLKEYLANIPQVLAKLEVLYTGGDRLDSHDALKARELVGKGFVNAYGPAENGVISTLYAVSAEEQDKFINGVPIGRAIHGSGAHVMDERQQLVPLGVIGELVVTGHGLARGYTDSTLDFGRFLDIDINGRVLRGYRTGDRVRYRPRDGLLEFFGRMDQQVKIRGHRVEPTEVENVMLACNGVQDAVVIVRHEHGDTRLVAFMTAKDESTEKESTNDQVEGWVDHFETNTYSSIDTMGQSAIGRDFTGWTSMIDGNDIDKVEMEEWLRDTIDAIHDGRPAGNVLEIGTGSGMILFNLRGVESYVGLEPSPSMADFVNKIASSTPALGGKAEVQVGTATDLGGLGDISPELVIVNSVAQYFPSADYLVELIRNLILIPGVKRLHFGDMRPNTLNQQFLAARALYLLRGSETKEAVRKQMAEIESREEELLVDPAFFTALAHKMPEQIAHVEILPKVMEATNELSTYRYAAVVHLRNSEPSIQVKAVPVTGWIDYEACRMTREGLESLLKHAPDQEPLAIGNIPHSKAALERRVVISLEDQDEQALGGDEEWWAAMRRQAASCPALSAADLMDMGKQAGFRVELSWARQQSNHGALDAVFYRSSSSEQGHRAWFRFPHDNVGASVPSTNRPLQRQQHRRIEKEVRTSLQSLLPSYMIPSQLFILEKMPVNANGKVDRQALNNRVQAVLATKQVTTSTLVPPRNDIESALCEEFSAVLGAPIGVTDNFFDRGGHSLLATKVAAATSRRLDRRVTVKDIFEQPVLGELAKIIEAQYRLSSLQQHDVWSEPSPFEELPGQADQFIQRHLAPQIECQGRFIVDAYPATRMQKNHVFNPVTEQPRMPPQFVLDLPADTDIKRLSQAWTTLVQHFDIFRSVFLWAHGGLYQVVLDRAQVSIKIVQAGDDVASPEPVHLGQSLLRITIHKNQASMVRVALQISHALYDGVSLGHVVQSLHALLDGARLPTAPRFANYRRLIALSRPEGHVFWRSILRGAKMTQIGHGGNMCKGAERPGMVWAAARTIEVPIPVGSVTTATIFTAACALMLAKETEVPDVLFGRVVSGRQSLPEAYQSIVGPCVNIVPMRVSINTDAGLRQLLERVQDQYIQSLPFETLGWDELRTQCTDLPSDISNYGCCVTYQNLDMPPGFHIENPFARVDGVREEVSLTNEADGNIASRLMDLQQSPIHDVEIGGAIDPAGRSLRVTLEVSERLCDILTVDRMLRELCENISLLTAEVQ